MASLPDYLVIGAPKAGTTSLAAYLAAHPDVFMTPAKEVRFFDDEQRFARGPEWYARYFRGAEAFRRRGEATPTYLTSPVAPARMAEVVPGARLVAVLRQPAARAYSAYHHEQGWGAGHPPFEELVDRCRGLPTPDADPLLWGSRYLPQLRAVTAHFSEEQLLVVLFEDLQRDPAGTFARVCRFLDVEERAPGNLGTVYNSSRRLRSRVVRQVMEGVWTLFPERLMQWLDRLNSVPVRYPPLEPQVESRIEAMFADENAALARWLGLDLSPWTSRPAGTPG